MRVGWHFDGAEFRGNGEFFRPTAGCRPDAVTDLLYKKSGLLGMSGVSSDVRDLLASDSPRAARALDVFA